MAKIFSLTHQSRSGCRSGQPPQGLAVTLLALALSAWGCQSTGQFAAPNPVPLKSVLRATTDCPDDSNLPQIHLLYAIPYGANDLKLDKDGSIRASVTSAQTWFAQESGGRQLRFDTCQGNLDVTFVRLPRTDQEYSIFGVNARDQIEYDLWLAGFSESNKIYAVYYSGTFEGCGQGPHPPALPGNVVVLAPRTKGCGGDFPASGPAVWEFTLIHEIFHALGAVSPGAPNYCQENECPKRRGHVRGPLNDLMSAPGWEFPSRLDDKNDDYWEHSNANLVDVSQSAFLEPTPTNAPLPPPVWPLHLTSAIPASQEPTLRSPSTNKEVKLQIVNRSGRVLHAHWLNHSGVRELDEPIPVDDDNVLDTFQGHLWVIADDQGKALAIYRAPAEGWGRAVHVTP